MPVFQPAPAFSARPAGPRLHLPPWVEPHPRMRAVAAPAPQPVPGSTPAPPPPEVPPSETPPEVNDPAVPHEHEPIRDPQPFQPGALH